MKIWEHSQNLNVKDDDRGREIRLGSKAWHGRAWLHLGRATELEAEWAFGRFARHCMAEIHLNSGGGDAVQFSLGMPWLFCIWFTIGGYWLRRFMPGRWTKSFTRPGELWFMPVEREIGVSIHDGIVWVSLWRDAKGWSSKDPWWWIFNFSPVDMLLGRTKHRQEERLAGRIPIFMPEGPYLATYRLFDIVYWRPRWPFERRISMVEIEPDQPIPIPGKGENSYDIDDDAIHSMVCAAETPQAAAKALAVSQCGLRQRYGGRRWQPEIKPTTQPAG